MPPQSPIPNENQDRPAVSSSNPLKPARKPSSGPIVGIFIILIILVLGALYFWGALLNQRENPEDQLPLIPGDSSTTLE